MPKISRFLKSVYMREFLGEVSKTRVFLEFGFINHYKDISIYHYNVNSRYLQL